MDEFGGHHILKSSTLPNILYEPPKSITHPSFPEQGLIALQVCIHNLNLIRGYLLQILSMNERFSSLDSSPLSSSMDFSFSAI